MATYTRAMIRTALSRRLGFMSGLDNYINSAIDEAVVEGEAHSFLPWFLEYDTNLGTNPATVAGVATVAQPTGFIREHEEHGGVWRLSGTEWVELKKDAYGAHINLQAGSGTPTRYSLFGTNVVLFPTPDAAVTLRMIFYRKDQIVLSDTVANLWITHAPLLLQARAGELLSKDLQNQRKEQEFAREVATQYTHLRNSSIARLQSNLDASMGDS